MKSLLLILLIPIMGLGQNRELHIFDPCDNKNFKVPTETTITKTSDAYGYNGTEKSLDKLKRSGTDIYVGSDNKHAPVWKTPKSVLGKNTEIVFATDTLDEGVVYGLDPKEITQVWNYYDSIVADTVDEGIVIDLSTPYYFDKKEYPSYLLIIRHKNQILWKGLQTEDGELLEPDKSWSYVPITFKSKSDAIEFLERRKTEESEFVALYYLSTASKIDLKLQVSEKVIKEKVVEKEQVIQEYKWR